jgi:hypothetical protein
MTFVWFLLAVAGCGALVYLAYLIEPHWVSKDGKRFLCAAQPISVKGTAEGRMREARVIVMPDGALHVSFKRHMRRRGSLWKIMGKAPQPPRNREVFLLSAKGGDPEDGMIALRLPTKSRAVPVLDDVLTGTR